MGSIGQCHLQTLRLDVHGTGGQVANAAIVKVAAERQERRRISGANA